TFGPALFLTGDIENIGGDVFIKNDKGSLGQLATIFGKLVDIKIPQGVAVIDLKDGTYFAGGNPYSEWQNAMFWPGGNAATGFLPDANAAFTQMFGTGTGFGRPSDTDRFIFVMGNCTGGDCYGNSIPSANATPRVTDFASYDSADSTGSRQSSAIYGGSVIIKAKYIDINAGITIGPDTDWSVNLDASLMSPVVLFHGLVIGGGEIAVADYMYEHNQVSNPIFDLRNARAANGDSLIGAQYDAQNKRIILGNVRASADGGSLVLEGGIMNTSGSALGNIHVNGGLGDVEVNNLTGRALVVQDVYAGNSGTGQAVVSTVDITDTNYAASSNHWVYQYTPQDGVKVYRGADGSSIAAGDMSPQGYDGTYRPLSGLRWEWQQVAFTKNEFPQIVVTDPGAADNLWQWNNVLQCCNAHWEQVGDPINPWRYVYTDSSGNPAYTTTPAGHTTVQGGLP
ncbi:MAG: hypothetical protein ABUU24_10160, partial [Variovorax sp.]